MTKFHPFTRDEAEASLEALDVLARLPWAAGLCAEAGRCGGVTETNRTMLFEARFALALHDAGIAPVYEQRTGVGDTSVDFAFGPWLVELVSLQETQAAKEATHENGRAFSRLLASPSGDGTPEELERDKQSLEGETLKAIQRIVAKAANEKGEPAKFPPPINARMSMLVVDLRSIQGLDGHDLDHIAFGAQTVPPVAACFWQRKPIAGAFHPDNPARGAGVFRERVHFLTITHEQTYARGELRHRIWHHPNPHLFASLEEAEAALDMFPLYRSSVG
jgi:hypothetical protein